MPILNKSPKRLRHYKKHGDNAVIQKIYNSSQWQKLRNAHLMQFPLCEVCQSNNKTTLAQEVHHIKPISTGATELEMKDIALDPFNLMSLCTKCHHEIHKNMRKDR